MQKIFPRLAATLFAAFLSHNAAADIDPGATNAASDFEYWSGLARGYVEFHYGADYGSAAMDDEATRLHDLLHAWENGEATETEVADQMRATKATWNKFRQTINPAGLLNAGDFECDRLYEETKRAYLELRHTLNNAH